MVQQNISHTKQTHYTSYLTYEKKLTLFGSMVNTENNKICDCL